MDLHTTRALLRKHGLRPNKRLGQHFLVNPLAAEQIIDAAQVGPEDTVLEIGPGLGALTGGLLAKVRRVIAVELDTRLCAILEAELGSHPGLTVIRGDFLTLDIPELAAETGAAGLKVVGNLPYHITGPAMRKILDHFHLLRRAVVTVQREVADRILARPRSKAFGILSVMAQYYARPEPVLQLTREAFYPQPQVVSTVVILTSRPQPPISLSDESQFITIVKALFGHRRKMARNALRIHPNLRLSQQELEELSRRAQMDLGRRAETMSLEELGRLSNALWEIQHAKSRD
jgi:16S rRNA (adenine1518-N6/adenine1519-N6)-dimethyltransferase